MSSKKTKNEGLISRVETVLDNIRPYLITDGGNVKVLEITRDNRLILEFVGTCGNCPMSTMTFKAGIEEAIRKAVPEISIIEVSNMTTV